MSFFMKFLLSLLLICIGLFAMSCSMDLDMNQELSDQGKMLYGFVGREGKLLGKKYDMSQVSVGGGAKEDGIWLMSLDFQRYDVPLNEEEARKLIINCLHDYLEAVNRDEKLRPFLKIYPFKPENIDIGIFNFDPISRKESFYPNITVVTAYEGKIAYFTVDESNPYRYKTKKYESYDEALAILKKENEQKKNND